MSNPEQSPTRRALEVDMVELTYAFETYAPEVHYYLDLETGDVPVVTEDISAALDALRAELGADEIDPIALDEALERHRDLQGIADNVREALQVEIGYGTRYVEVPRDESHDAYRDMEDFIETLDNPGLEKLLSSAIQGRGAFRRFKDVLGDYPREEERWFQFKDARVRERVLDWLRDKGIEPIEPKSPT